MIEQSKNLLVQSGATWVLWLLLALSVMSLAVGLDRTRLFWRQREDIDALARELQRLLSQGDLEGARRYLVNRRSTAAQVALSGLAQWERGATAVKEAIAAASLLKRAQLRQRLLLLGTIGNNAPFIGLLGTVIGIVGAFDELASTQRVGIATAAAIAPERVMASIAEALVLTALGLIVAIPAVALFNYFQGRLLVTLGDAETVGHVLLTHIEKSPEARDGTG